MSSTHQQSDCKTSFTIRAVAWIASHPWGSIALSLLLVGVMAFGATRLNFSNDIRVFFSEDNPDLQAYEAMEKTYSKSTNVLMVLSPRDPSATIFTPENLAIVQEVTQKAWKTPFSRRVDSLANFQHSYAEGDDLMVSDLVPESTTPLQPADVARIRSIALADPMLVNRLISPDGKVTGINIPIHLPGEKPLAEQPEVANFVRNIARETEAAHPGMDVRLTGIVMINQELAEEAAHDFMTLMPMMFVFIVGTLGIMLRSITAPLCAFAVILLGNVAAFGAAGWMGVQLSPPVISAVNMIMTLAIAGSVHVLASYKSQYVGSITRPEAMKLGMLDNFGMIFFTSLTSVIGYASLNTSESPPFRELGTVVALGVVFVWLFVNTILPPMMILLPGRPGKVPLPGSEGPQAPPFFLRLSDYIALKPVRVLVVSSLITVAFGTGIFRNELNDEFLKYFDRTSEFRQDTDFTINRLTGFEYIEYSLESGRPGGIADPDYLRKVDAFATWFRQQAPVRHVYAHTDMIKRLNKNLNADDPTQFRIPENAALATDCLTVYEMSLPFGLDLNDRINVDKSATLFRASLSGITSNEMITLDDRAQAWLREHQLSPQSKGTGQSMMFARIGLRNISSQLWGTIISTILISGCMIFVTRSFKLAMASLLPNLVPAGIGFGIWGYAVGQIGLATSIVVGMTLGIVVDDTVHFVMHFIKGAKTEGSAEKAVRHTMLHCGWPMITSNIALILGFGVLGFSSFELNRGMGILSALIIAVALLFDLIFTPALLLVLTRKRKSP